MKKFFFILCVCFLNIAFAVDAQLEIIKKSQNLPKIVISVASDAKDLNLLNRVKTVIAKDLQVSGHFEVLKIDKKSDYNKKPDMLFLSRKGVDLFLNIKAQRTGFGAFILETKLYDVNSKVLVLNKTFSTKYEDRYPFLSHRVAISINKYLKAPSIDWMDKFVIFSVYKDAKEADILIGDYTLTYQKTIVKGGLNIFPKWANTKQDSFYYTSYNKTLPTLVKVDLFTGKRKVVMTSQGMIVASDISSDGSKVLVTASPKGQPDIYIYDTKRNVSQRLTSYKGIDVGAHFVENDTKIVFVSDRLNYPNIFSKSIKGRGVQRLVYHGRNNSSATTHGNYVVYSSRDKINEFGKKSFNLYLMSTKSDFLRRLTSSGVNQFPKFSNDGESILHLKNEGTRSYLGIIRLNYNKSFTFPLSNGKIQSIDW